MPKCVQYDIYVAFRHVAGEPQSRAHRAVALEISSCVEGLASGKFRKPVSASARQNIIHNPRGFAAHERGEKNPSHAPEVQNCQSGMMKGRSTPLVLVLMSCDRRHAGIRFPGSPFRGRSMPPSGCPKIMRSINLLAGWRPGPDCHGRAIFYIRSFPSGEADTKPLLTDGTKEVPAPRPRAGQPSITRQIPTKTTIRSHKTAITYRFGAISTAKPAGVPLFMPLTSANNMNLTRQAAPPSRQTSLPYRVMTIFRIERTIAFAWVTRRDSG